MSPQSRLISTATGGERDGVRRGERRKAGALKNVGQAHSFILARTHVTTLESGVGAIVLELKTRKPKTGEHTVYMKHYIGQVLKMC